ncbi:type I polyketide synthase [Paraburkholderia ginsengisoli]|uniref:Type I polyketide synthase n=1 Tax=Paraburkholderia ginsengisoli TaxID=311231 RepID=A0A7T4T9E8_9BURK|nr:type I polyketide synthase [Paraburkholderia ginsengisoli]QQC64310.1 type I polyketide synthase [Paraburkholderia ginsengisoli]
MIESTLLPWSDTEIDGSIQSRFEKVAESFGDKPAICTSSGRISYRELNMHANAVSAFVANRIGHVAPGSPVPILIPQGIDFIASMLGILKAGFAFVPLDPSAPATRNAKIIRDIGCPIVLTDSTSLGGIGDEFPDVRALDVADIERDAGWIKSKPLAVGSDLAYVLYTSGSTGTPKGVMQTHGHLLHNTRTHGASFGITAADRQSLLYPCNVYGGIRDTFNALLTGASLHVLSVKTEELSFLPEWIEAEGITLYCSIATIFRRLLEWVDAAHIFKSIRIVKLGGEAVYDKDVEGFRRHFAEECKLSCGLASTETGAITQHFIGKHSNGSVGLGYPVPGKNILLQTEDGATVGDGEMGEIVVHSRYVTRGYWNAPDMSAAKVRRDPEDTSFYFYHTGDLARRQPDGSLVHVGRKDQLVKIRGNRIEIRDVEQAILRIDLIKDVVVSVAPGNQGEDALIAYVETASETASVDPVAIRERLSEIIPSQMIPTYFVHVPRIPLLPNGKKDRKALPALPAAMPSNDTPRYAHGNCLSDVSRICGEALRIERPDPSRNFFELGADSLKLAAIHRKISLKFGLKFPLIDLFRHPSIESLSRHLDAMIVGRPSGDRAMIHSDAPAGREPTDTGKQVKVAIIGIACRFPQCETVNEFWSHLMAGDSLLSEVPHAVLKDRGVPEHLLAHPAYVRTTAELSGIETFDYDFFGFTKGEAELLDPQFRLLLECAHEALEDAGETALDPDDTVGVFTSVGKTNYLHDYSRKDPGFLEMFGERRALLFNDRTYSAAMVAYKLNLDGPAFNIDSACSSSLVAIHNAVRNLQAGDCTLALTGGCRVITPHGVGYLHGEAGIESADGKVRPFDRDASGTIFGNGAGVILLKRLDDAIRDGNHIYAVIEGSAVTNDGSHRAGFSAPSIFGQSRAIHRAHRDAGIRAADIVYVEAHGTGTAIGDPIEVAALNEAFADAIADGHNCLLGALKSNIGHVSTAAGVAGLIKTALVMKTGFAPPTLNFNAANPDVPFSSGPFRVSNRAEQLPSTAGRRLYAGVSSFGFGGTNAHVVLSAPPAPMQRRGLAANESGHVYIVPLSAKTPDALRATIARLRSFITLNRDANLASISRTLSVGRRHWAYRTAIVCNSLAELDEELSKLASQHDYGTGTTSRVTFLFPGLGPQHLNMMAGLYARFGVFRAALDECFAILQRWLDVDLKALVYSSDVANPEATSIIRSSKYGQPCMYAFEYALAKLWLSFGVTPDSYLGHSLGEYVAATLSGVFSLEDALKVIVARGTLMQEAPGGCMYAVSSCDERIEAIVKASGAAVAAKNSPNQTIIAGTSLSVAEAVEELSRLGMPTRLFQPSHAFHSYQMRHAAPRLLQVLLSSQFHRPETPFTSNVTGTWISADDAVDSNYWVSHMCETVMFDKGLRTIAADRQRVFLEVGPGQTLTTLIETDSSEPITVVPSCKHHRNTANDVRVLYEAMAACWSHGCDIDWNAVNAETDAPLIPLPTYPFERKRAWLDDDRKASLDAGMPENLGVPHHAIQGEITLPEVVAVIKGIWERLLGCGDIANDSNFFELGGDSMLAVQVQRNIVKAIGVKVELKKLYRLIELQALSAHVHALASCRMEAVKAPEFPL